MSRRHEIAGAIVEAADRIMRIQFDPHMDKIGEILGPLSEWATGKRDSVSWAGYHWIWREYGRFDRLSGEAVDLAVRQAGGRALSGDRIRIAAQIQAIRFAAGLDCAYPRSNRAAAVARILEIAA